MLQPEHLRSINASVLCWLATADTEGAPSVSPKEVFAAYGSDGLVIANIASPGSAKNIRNNPAVCISMVDIFDQRGHKFYGTARIILDTDSKFVDMSKPLLEITKGKYPFSSLFYIKVTSIKPIIAPSYILYPEVSDKDRRNSAYETYGVKPIKD